MVVREASESEVVVIVRKQLLVLVRGEWLIAAAAGPDLGYQAGEGVDKVIAGTEEE